MPLQAVLQAAAKVDFDFDLDFDKRLRGEMGFFFARK
jgi:hypothetical protein